MSARSAASIGEAGIGSRTLLSDRSEARMDQNGIIGPIQGSDARLGGVQRDTVLRVGECLSTATRARASNAAPPTAVPGKGDLSRVTLRMATCSSICVVVSPCSPLRARRDDERPTVILKSAADERRDPFPAFGPW